MYEEEEEENRNPNQPHSAFSLVSYMEHDILTTIRKMFENFSKDFPFSARSPPCRFDFTLIEFRHAKNKASV